MGLARTLWMITLAAGTGALLPTLVSLDTALEGWCSRFYIGNLLMRQHQEAITGSRVQDSVLATFRSSVDKETWLAWEKQAADWENDPSTAPDPYCADAAGRSIYISW